MSQSVPPKTCKALTINTNHITECFTRELGHLLCKNADTLAAAVAFKQTEKPVSV